MNTKYIFLILLLGIAFYFCSEKPNRVGTNYYFDSLEGNDENNGLSPDKAWKSLENIQSVEISPGDSLLLKRGSVFMGIFEITGKGTPDARIVIDAYGIGDKPCITAPDSSLYALRVRNSDYITLQNLEIVNKGTQRLVYRTGVKILCEDYGISHNIILNSLYIHDVNGSLIKHDGGGSGILIQNKWKDTVSVFDSLLIENCIIRKCERNAIIWSAPWDRKNWYPSTSTIVRKNLIEEVPGDGIVPIGCDGALVEYNLMRNCTDLLDIKEAAAGIWPWSCDNTLIQFNEVSNHKAPWDAQGFDSDFNCTNTHIQYNYSHDNEGGFVLICNPGPSEADTTHITGNIGTVIQYNISINDGIRKRETRVGIFSPTIHIAGSAEDTRINNNILHVNTKPLPSIDRSMITSDSWGGYANNTRIVENVFYTPETSTFKFSKSTNDCFDGNYYLGTFKGKPKDENGRDKSAYYKKLLEKDPEGFGMFTSLMRKVEIADGAAHVMVVNKKAIEDFFVKMKEY
jgi:hypothetical protein